LANIAGKGGKAGKTIFSKNYAGNAEKTYHFQAKGLETLEFYFHI